MQPSRRASSQQVDEDATTPRRIAHGSVPGAIRVRRGSSNGVTTPIKLPETTKLGVMAPLGPMRSVVFAAPVPTSPLYPSVETTVTNAKAYDRQCEDQVDEALEDITMPPPKPRAERVEVAIARPVQSNVGYRIRQLVFFMICAAIGGLGWYWLTGPHEGSARTVAPDAPIKLQHETR